MARVIEPKVKFLSYGPVLKIENAEGESAVLTPDDLVYAASGVTFKDMGFIDEVIEMKKNGIDFESKKIKSIIKSAGAGHASLSTSQGFWTVLQGDCSKLVDSIFTGATYISALMPSGRRVPISKEEIVVPKGIRDAGEKVERLYLDISEANIEAYEFLQEHDVKKQEASKIVQYGHSGGGFLFMPLETLVNFSKLAESNPGDMPLEGIEIIAQLEKLVHENGMGLTYESRKNAPRAGNPNPNIFHHRKTLAQEIFESSFDIAENARIISESYQPSEERDKRIIEYLANRNELLKNPGENWKKSLRELEDIVGDFNDSVHVQTIVNSPWRVWGEVKRHRTLSQNVESIYHATERALAGIPEIVNDINNLKKYVSLPDSVAQNEDNLKLWKERFIDSVFAYKVLVENGIKESDAIALIPRGLKLAVIKNFDLYNLTTGYMSLRTCAGTVEPEMRAITENERRMIKESPFTPEPVKKLLSPKCHYGGFCPEADYKTCCGLVKGVVPNYDEEMHKSVWEKRESEIRKNLGL